jgi:hypothetical protein
MPVIIHNTVPAQPHPEPLHPFTKYLLKGQKITVLVKYPQLSIRPIDHMINIPAQSNPFRSCHKASLSKLKVSEIKGRN